MEIAVKVKGSSHALVSAFRDSLQNPGLQQQSGFLIQKRGKQGQWTRCVLFHDPPNQNQFLTQNKVRFYNN
jgi:hypothetical protein